MVQLTGFTAASGAELLDDDLHLAPELGVFTLWDWPPLPGVYCDTVGNNSGTEASTLPVQQSSKLIETSVTAKAFSQDWYDTIHLLPNPMSLGNLLSSQERDFQVWNAYFTTQNLASVTPTGDSGLVLSQPSAPPTVFTALESRTYTLNISTSGPAVIDATYTFDFPSDDPILKVTGNRVITFPFQPNWVDPVIERLEWKTQILQHEDGSEQGIKLRQEPRKVFEYRTTLQGVDRQRFNALIWGWQARLFAVPVWSDATRVASDVSIGDTTINVETDDLDFSVGGLAVFITDTNNYEVSEITGVTSTTITLALGTSQAWSKHSPVLPARLARMEKVVSQGLLTPDVYDGNVKFAVDVNSNETATDSVTLYRGLPVMDVAPYWHKPIKSDFKRDLEVLDNSTGIRTIDDKSDYGHFTQGYHWVKQGRPDITAFREWLFSRQGKLVPFWTTTFQVDITMSDLISDTGTVLEIRYVGYTAQYSQSISRRDIRIELKDGTVFYRRITASSDTAGSTEDLVIDSALGQQVEPKDVRMISFMYLARLDSDKIEFAWRNPQLVEISSTVKGLNYDV